MTLPAGRKPLSGPHKGRMGRAQNTLHDAASDDDGHQVAGMLFRLGGDLMRKKAKEAA